MVLYSVEPRAQAIVRWAADCAPSLSALAVALTFDAVAVVRYSPAFFFEPPGACAGDIPRS